MNLFYLLATCSGNCGKRENLHGEVIEKTFPASRPLQKVVDTTLNSQRQMVLLATIGCSSVKEQCKVSIDGGSRVISSALQTGLVDQLCRGRVAVARCRS